MTPPAGNCPCGRGPSYAACCGRAHADPARIPDAETLMRARYSAFVLDDRDFLLATWNPAPRPAALPAADPDLKWLGLSVRTHQPAGDTATVEFVARSRWQGRGQRLHERSRFERLDGCWYYRDGDILGSR